VVSIYDRSPLRTVRDVEACLAEQKWVQVWQDLKLSLPYAERDLLRVNDLLPDLDCQAVFDKPYDLTISLVLRGPQATKDPWGLIASLAPRIRAVIK
jgi:hypothetical protein